MTQPLSQCKVFPPMVTSMVEVGEETGALADMLTRIANTYALLSRTSILYQVLFRTGIQSAPMPHSDKAWNQQAFRQDQTPDTHTSVFSKNPSFYLQPVLKAVKRNILRILQPMI